MKKSATLLLIALLVIGFGSPYGLAKEDEAAKVTQDAFNDVKVATELFKQANDMVTDGFLNRQKGEAAMSLFVRAGQLFERAEGIFKAVGFNYISQRDIDGAKAAKESCIKTIEELKQRLTTLSV